MIETSRIPTIDEGTETADLGEDTVLYSSRLNKMMKLDQHGALVWKLCDGKRSVGAIIELLADAFPSSRRQIEQDVRQVLIQWSREGLLRLKTP